MAKALSGVQEPQQKILDIDTAVQMLHVVLPEGNEHLEPFSRFLKEQTEYKYMNLDQWTSFYRFSEEVAFYMCLMGACSQWSHAGLYEVQGCCALASLLFGLWLCDRMSGCPCITMELMSPDDIVAASLGIFHVCRWVWIAATMTKGMLGHCCWTTM